MNSPSPDPYAAIRPFNDNEVGTAIDRLLASPDFIDALLRLRLGGRSRFLGYVLRPFLRFYLRRQLRSVNTVLDLQLRIRGYMERMIQDTTDGFTISGLDELSADSAYLFISNHRDITLDPAFTNYALHMAGHDTLRIAIGDNLLTEQWVSDLMRLNKSFIVQRSVSGPRELLAASKLLARYIRHSVQQDNVPIWIAQREGRAKDGLDKTEPAVIKMLSLGREKAQESFAEHMRGLRIVPVSISYELDPCDEMKARELYERATTGTYEKAEQEDVASIGQGISGQKGHVHVSFGSPLGQDLESPEAVATAIDEQVLENYQFHPINVWAYRRLHGEPQLGEIRVGEGSITEQEFDARISAMPEEVRPFALAGYANSLRVALERALPA